MRRRQDKKKKRRGDCDILCQAFSKIGRKKRFLSMMICQDFSRTLTSTVKPPLQESSKCTNYRRFNPTVSRDPYCNQRVSLSLQHQYLTRFSLVTGIHVPPKSGYFLYSDAGIWEMCRHAFYPHEIPAVRYNATAYIQSTPRPFDIEGLKGVPVTSELCFFNNFLVLLKECIISISLESDKTTE